MIRAKGIVDGTQWEYSRDIDQTYPARVQASAGETISRGRWGLNWPIVSHILANLALVSSLPR